ncbi:MAG: DUF3368 domain-containing protein [Gammaproteobacteria bacterium]|nr:DUF3368 domain-containing protein [Gammaproteobacteria bacterium]
MNWISNTGPLIALAKIDHLHLLQDLAAPAKVQIPAAVGRELWAKPGPEIAALETAADAFIQIVPAGEPAPAVKVVTMKLDEGERQVITLGSRTEKSVMLMDDAAGRKAGQKLGLSIIGTGGLLLKAKQRGLIPQIHPLLFAMLEQGYWLSDELVSHIRRVAGETT